MKRVVLLLACCSLSACVWNPPNRTNSESTNTISLSGYAPSGSTVTLTARNLNTNAIETIGTASASASPAVTTPVPLSHWSATLTPAARFWAPQSAVVDGTPRSLNGLATSGGRIEITASSGSAPFKTFSAAAQNCVLQKMSTGLNIVQAGDACYDGQSLVVFDNSGVGNNASTDPWVSDFKPAVQPAGVQWEIGHYKVEGKTIYGLVCRPTTPGKHKTVIINHGGFELNEISLNNFCIPSAGGGWVVAMSAYRGEKIRHSAPSGAPDQPIVSGASVVQSQGEIELCLGEITDVMRLTEIVRGWPSVDPDRVLMWGHSHGACITVRALQRGVKVKAAAAFAAPTDMAQWYKYCSPGTPCDTAVPNNRLALSTTFGDITTTPRTPVTPDQSRIPYDWRSPVTYAEDLKARTDVKILLLQGNADPLIHPSQGCALARAYAPSISPAGTASMNWHLGASGAAVAATPVDCIGFTGLTWQSGAPPRGTWPQSRYLLVYDNLDHSTVLTGWAWGDFLNWVGVIFP